MIDAHPSYYEAVPKGLPDVRTRVEALQAKFNEESRVYKLELVSCDSSCHCDASLNFDVVRPTCFHVSKPPTHLHD